MGSAEDILKQYWGYDGFRLLQREIIDSICSGRDTLALLPTGGGKSVCYQVPALMQEGLCLVISPLIALMQDQVLRLHELGIAADCLHSGLRYKDVQRILDNAIHGAYKLLYVSPERLQTGMFKDYLPGLDVSLIAVDEAHCISQWGHDFRPDYLKIAELRAELPEVPVLALTATATPHVQQDIAIQLKLRQPVLFVQSFERSNIEYSVRYTENKNHDLVQWVRSCKTSSIIYCRSRKQTEMLHKYLQQNGLGSAVYHAGLAKDKREAAQETWMHDRVRIMIATTAFGMGIDKPDVGLVVNYDAPEHLEAYYQEAGRGGRNGQPAASIVLYNQTDISRLEDSIDLQYPAEDYLRHVYQCVVEYLQIPISAEPYQYYPFDLGDFSKKFKLNATQASYALKLMEREELWTISESVFNPPTLLCIAGRQEIDDLIHTYPQYAYFVTALLRLYGSLFIYPTGINLFTVARQAKLKKEEVEPLLLRLQSMGLFEYHPQAEGPQLFFHHYRVDSRQLIIDLKRISELKQRHKARTDAMISFLNNTVTCRTKILLPYFGEQVATDCGHCDVCLSKKHQKHVTEEQMLAILRDTTHSSLQLLVASFPAGQKEHVVDVIRRMADEKKLHIDPMGNISIRQQPM